ncbi:MAG: hypothetical protein JNM17_07700, partial [Archangium sp.]|nr:hypothetical protein [Archangium sp.]
PGICPISQRPCTRAIGQCFGYSPGTYASMFIYNYNFPDGLDEGDLLFTLSGSIQEFTSTTQMVFPAWTTAERVRRLPESQWNKWLQYARPYEINARTCGQDNAPVPFLTDSLCGHNRRNMKMESLESGLVKLRRITFPKKFVNCDFNSNGEVPFFCENPEGVWHWDKCGDTETETDRIERECTVNCTIGLGEHAGTLCAEQSTFNGFGQYVVEMALPGPSRLNMDDALPRRMNVIAATLTPPRDAGFDDAGMAIDAGPPPSNPSVRVGGYTEGTEVAVTCDAPARFKFGNDIVFASDGDPIITADQIVRHTLGPNETSVAFQATTTVANCTVGLNARTRINIVTKDAVPELDPDCDENDRDATRAQECKNLRGAEFDLIGHLRHVQPARPRWVVIPRAPDDLCCYPGPGLECPRPIKRCAAQ